MQRLSRFVTPLLVVALCALVGWWATRLMAGAPIAIPPAAVVDGSGGESRVDAVLASARLFGSRKPGVLSDNVRALGVVADASGRGSVIVSVDGQVPKVYRVGDTIDGRTVSAIRPDEIELEAGGARQVFRLPPARATAPGLTIIGSAAPVMPVMPESREQPAPSPSMLAPRTAMPFQPGASPMQQRVPVPSGLAPPPGVNQ